MKKFAKALIGTALAVSMLIAVPACGTIPQVEEGRISAQELIESPYAIDPSKTDYESGEPGLRNPYIIGIDKDKYENEVLYPTPEGAKVFEVSAPANEFDDSTRAVQTAINQARAWKEENPNIVGDGDVGTFLKRYVFQFGASESWKEITVSGTGGSLSEDAFLDQFAR